ncbi:DUF3291 domain-containing protein [Methylobacterium sp. OAE515]|uniref:DUF3291 domain-containing protein n=1 Tax=Methylobacterium sp. OAE515 TaxID=2817895 RepID=UPI00178BEBAB
MAKLALYTFGVLRDLYHSDALRDFSGSVSSILATLAVSEGFIAHAGQARPDLRGAAEVGEDYGPWGPYTTPRFFDQARRTSGASIIQTLSLWRDLKSAHSFSYGGLHRAALKRRSEWFEHSQWPGYVLWWVSEEAFPTWSEGVRLLETLADEGSTASGFDFAHLYDREGRPQAKI